MRSSIRWLAVCFLGIGQLLAMPAGAQNVTRGEDIRVKPSGECPTEKELRLFPGVIQISGIANTVVKHLDVILEQGGEPRSRPVDVHLNFNTQLAVYGFNADHSKIFVRAKTSRNAGGAGLPNAVAVCGWISREAVVVPRNDDFKNITRPQPLQMRDISPIEKEHNNLLNAKAVVHDLSITGEVRGIDAFSEAGAGEPFDKIRLFDTFLVFDRAERPPRQPGDETRFWLIGEQADDRSGATILRGWVRQRDVVIWPSRLALQWKGDAEVSAFVTLENLKSGTNPIAPPQRLDRTDYDDQITRRLPVLEQFPPPGDIADKLPLGESLERRRSIAMGLIEAYRIATPGQACRRDNPRDCISARTLDRLREGVAKMEIAAGRMDILFLVDATESMDPYFSATVKAIRQYIEHHSGGNRSETDIDVRFGISLYGDYRTQIASVDTVNYAEAVPFFRPANIKPDPMEDLVRDPKAFIFKDIHQDRLEAPFAAVIRAATQTRWRSKDEVPLRVIVHIADDGNRGRGQTSLETMQERFPEDTRRNPRPPQSTIRETLGEDNVVTAMRQGGVIYVPVAVLGFGSNPGHPVSAWERLHQQQAQRILDLLGDDAPVKKIAISYNEQSTETPSAAIEKIGNAIGSSLDTAVSVASDLERRKCASDPKAPACTSVPRTASRDPAILRLVDRVASAAAGLTASEAENIYSRDQSIVTVYAPARTKEGRETFTHWIALEAAEFEVLRNALTTVCRKMADQDSKNPILNAIREVMEVASDEDFTDLSVGEILGKRFGIPNLERTDLFSRTRQEIDQAHRAWQSGEERRIWQNWHSRVCKAAAFTQYMDDNLRVDPEKISCNLTNGQCDVPERDRRKYRWWVQVTKDIATYYVPLDILP